ncbi:MAG: MAPEG family protein, partial [Caulobacteraceae bacterium]
ATATVRTQQYGSKWNTGARDEELPPAKPIVGRLQRAQSNLYETLPLFAAVVLIAHVAGRENAQTALGAQLYFWGRVIYVPLYALGVPMVRSLVFLVSLIGLIMVLVAVLKPA